VENNRKSTKTRASFSIFKTSYDCGDESCRHSNVVLPATDTDINMR